MSSEILSTPRDMALFVAGVLYAVREGQKHFELRRQKANGGTHEDKLLRAVKGVSADVALVAAEVKSNREVVGGKLDAMAASSVEQHHKLEMMTQRQDGVLTALQTSLDSQTTIMSQMVQIAVEKMQK